MKPKQLKKSIGFNKQKGKKFSQTNYQTVSEKYEDPNVKSKRIKKRKKFRFLRLWNLKDFDFETWYKEGSKFTLNKIDIPKFINGFEKSITLSLVEKMKINEI